MHNKALLKGEKYGQINNLAFIKKNDRNKKEN